MPDLAKQSVVIVAPCFHLGRAVVQHKQGGQSRQEGAEHDALFDEPVVAASIHRRQVAVEEGPVLALEAAGERSDGARL